MSSTQLAERAAPPGHLLESGLHRTKIDINTPPRCEAALRTAKVAPGSLCLTPAQGRIAMVMIVDSGPSIRCMTKARCQASQRTGSPGLSRSIGFAEPMTSSKQCRLEQQDEPAATAVCCPSMTWTAWQ